ncbi:NAD-dependent epimerase/dehydratase family protein [Neolewinella antarctica]|uniref:NAD-dependent epimerase/dehydratase domain-containing protein n=1 Tax=Neolewinella antarctica TaxID=442734 RepID=A0ABX0X9X2_9BACT|nr:NAD-dependent epimerase/dehydratase family protein [Neolewinella antarctica]NJC25835.1 hypothetical protein [Neolewinella antarctica]
MALHVLLTGATGMIGKGVLLECLESSAVAKVLSVGRQSLGMTHPKLEELIHRDFTDFSTSQEQISAFKPGACFHCMGVSSLGMNETDYSRLTYDVTKSLADTIYLANDRAVFTYVSGAGTDSSEKGSLMWARVKGRTENYVINRGFGGAYAFRIGMVIPVKGVKSKSGWVNAIYTITRPIYGLFQKLDSVVTSAQVGQVMIKLAVARTPRQSTGLANASQVQGEFLEAKQIKALA